MPIKCAGPRDATNQGIVPVPIAKAKFRSRSRPKFGRDQRGATAVEYGMILAMIFLAMIGAVSAFGVNATEMWNDMSDTIVRASAN